MITANSQNRGIQAGVGQFVKVFGSFTSTEILTLRPLQFSPALYMGASIEANAVAFQIKYPPTAGRYQMQKVKCLNYDAYLTVLDAYNFVIEFHFFVSKNLSGFVPDRQHLNALAFVDQEFSGNIGLFVKSGQDKALAQIPITIGRQCVNEVFSGFTDILGIRTEGYVPGQNLNVNFSMSGNVNNNYYVGIIRADAISNEVDIVNGLGLNYAKIGNGPSQVEGIPSDFFLGGVGFVEVANVSTAFVTLDGTKFAENATYVVYIVYKYQGFWRTCYSGPINQIAVTQGIQPDFDINVVDFFGNISSNNCVKGISSDISLRLEAILKLSDYNAKLAAAGYSGVFSDYLLSYRAYYSGSQYSESGISVNVIKIDASDVVFRIPDFKPPSSGVYFVTIALVMRFPTHFERIYIPFELHFDAVTNSIVPVILDSAGLPTTELCVDDEGAFTIDLDLAECLVLTSIDGGPYFDSGIIDSLGNINTDLIELDQTVCVKTVCTDGASTEPDTDCCDYCAETHTITITYSPNTGGTQVDINANFSLLGGSVYYTLIPTMGNQTNGIQSFGGGFAQFYLDVGESLFINRIELELSNRCRYENNFNISYQADGFDNPPSSYDEVMTLVGCECFESPVRVEDCSNFASLEIEIDEINETITVGLIQDFSSAMDTDDLLCSFDGGQTFIPCPNVIMGEPNVFITYDASFQDSCPPIHLEEAIVALKPVFCTNRREIILENINNLLEITFNDSIQSELLTDLLYVSLNGGETFEVFDLLGAGYTPLSLLGNEYIVAFTQSTCVDGCDNLDVEVRLNLSDVTIVGNCPGYNVFSLEATYNEETKQFTVSKQGDESELQISELLFTLGGGNPFDANNSGIPYQEPVIGEGLFIAAWKIKLPDCASKILTATAWGCKFVSIKNLDEIPPISVILPELPLQVCVVDCCDLGLLISCEMCTISIQATNGDLSECTVNWIGPQGFTATGPVIEAGPEGMYTATVSCGGCTSSVSYFHDKPNAGTPIANPIIIN